MAATVQVNSGKYEKTTDPKRMLTNSVLTEVIRRDWESIKGFLPCRTATSIQYNAGATKAIAWNEGENPTSIDLPLNDGYYVPDGNPYAIPNGKESNRRDPEALYLVRHQDRDYSGPLGRGYYWGDGGGRRGVGANGYWSLASGVALVNGRGAAAPLVAVPAEKLAEIEDPKALLQRAAQLRTAATELTERLGPMLSTDAYERLIKPTLDEAAFLTELAGKIEAISK